VNQLNRI
jgi:phosphonate transport system substrate-binding protein